MSDELDPIVEAYFAALQSDEKPLPSEAVQVVAEQFDATDDDVWVRLLKFCQASKRSIA